MGLLLAATACREEFNEHYEASALAGLNVVQVLGEYEDLSLFAQLVEKAGLSTTLGESGIYTVVAPRNEQVQQWLDEAGYTVDNVPVALTAQEYRLLLMMVSQAGRVWERGQLLQALWDDGGAFVEDNTLTVTVKRLREKLGREGGRIATVRGIGYRWEEKP